MGAWDYVKKTVKDATKDVKKTVKKAVKGGAVGGAVAGPAGAIVAAGVNAVSKNDRTKNITKPENWDLTGDVKSVEKLRDDLTGKTAADQYKKQLEDLQQQREDAANAQKTYTQGQVAQGRTDIQQGASGALGALGGGYDQARADLSAAPNRMADLYNGGLGAGFQTDPGYEFRRQQGQKATEQYFAAHGGRGGGDALKAIDEYNQNFAANEYNNYAQRQMGLAGAADQYDYNRAAGLSSLASGYGQNAANTYFGTGQQLAGLGMQGAGINAGLTQAVMSGIQPPPPPGPSTAQQLASAGAVAAGTYFGGPAGGMAANQAVSAAQQPPQGYYV